jgi:hypothetical protein
MARNEVFRVYPDEETMLQVYNRRLRMADRRFDLRKPDLEMFMARYENLPVFEDVTEDGHRVVVTEGISLIDTMYSSMTAVDVQFLCKAIGHGTPEQAIAATEGLNAFLRDTKGQKRAKRAVKEALIADVGFVKVYYDYVEDMETKDIPEAAVKAQIVDVMREKGVDASTAAKSVRTTEDTPVILRDRVCLDHVPYDLIRYDPTAKWFDDVRWYAQYTKLPVGEVVQNPTYRAFVEDRYGKAEAARLLDDVRGDTTVRTGFDVESMFDQIGNDDTNDDARVTVVEMWDLETGLVTVFQKDKMDLVLHQRLNPLMFNVDLEDRSPFKPLIIREDPDEIEGLGDMRVIYPSLEELDEYRSNIATHIARTIPKLIGPDRALTPQGKKMLESKTWGGYVGLAENHGGQEITPLMPPPLPQESLHIMEKVQAGMLEATGANEALRGIFTEKQTTATETSIVNDAGLRRQAERKDALVEWWQAIGRTALQLMQVYYDQKRILRFTDDLGQEFVWDWSKEDIAIEADIQVDLTPKESLSRAERGQRAYQVLNLALAVPETDRTALFKWFYRELGLSESEIRTIVKTPEEVQAEQQAEAVAQLSVAPQRSGGAPPGLDIQQPRGGG